MRVRVDAGFGFNPDFLVLEARPAQYAVVARLTQAFKRLLPGISYEPVNRRWEMAEFEHRPHGWPQARRFVIARRFIQPEEAETTLFSMGRYIYRAWVTNYFTFGAGTPRREVRRRFSALACLRNSHATDIASVQARSILGYMVWNKRAIYVHGRNATAARAGVSSVPRRKVTRRYGSKDQDKGTVY